MSAHTRTLTAEEAVRRGEEAQRQNLRWMEAVQKFRQENPYPIEARLLKAFALGWTAAAVADKGVRAYAGGAD